MLRNYLKIAFRNIKRHKAYSFINICGLGIGMACCILILLYVTDELSYDRYHERGERIYRINAISSIGTTTRHYATVPPALAPGLADSIPEIEAFVRIMERPNLIGRYNDKNIDISDRFFVDSTLFKIFSHEFIEGSSDSALINPNSIVITEETANRIFGDRNPLGKIIDLGGSRTVQVTGVIKNVPRNSHFRFNAVQPLSFFRNESGRPVDFSSASYFCEWYAYLLLKEGVDVSDVERKIMETAEKKWGELYRQKGTTRKYPIQRFRDLHLRSYTEYEPGNPGDIDTVYLFSAIALFVLLIACFNFINLSTAKSANRAKEVGMRKVFGSYKKQLVKQFLSESIVMSLIGLLLGVLLVNIALSAFNGLTGKEFDLSQLMNLPVLLGLLGIVIVTGIIAGSFPSFILSAFNPVMVLRGKLSLGSKNSSLRKILVVVQFSISIFMIAGILTIVRQLEYIKNINLGFNKEQMIVIPFYGNRGNEESARKCDTLKDKILQNPSVVSASFSAHVPGGDLGYDAFLPKGKSREETLRAMRYWVGFNFIKTYGMEIILGRNFSESFSTDAGKAVIINEKAAEALGWGEDVIGRQLINVSRNNRRGTIVGVVKDFHSAGMKMEISPVVMTVEPGFFSFVSVRIRPENVSNTITYLENTLREVYPERQFDFNYYFIDDDFRNKYPEEEKVRQIYLTFGCLAVFVACLGLFGLASFTVEQRTKEIGVRKVLGASIREITLLLSKEFTKWVLVANIIAWPLAYYIMSKWLENFAYHISISWDIFVFSGISTVIIALFTVSFHSIKAARASPADALKYE
ncbi:MAG: ABC transporter permease [Candidatus Aminicenantes bacterium]|nr:MAG: ABC transporter permease [Candidatus Aminicenantes bacterium]